MKALITTITRSPKGNAIPATREVVADEIRVGRGAECEFRLADPRVPIHAKSISKGESGPQIVDTTNQVRGGSDERPQPLTVGVTFRIGPFKVDVVEAPAGADLALNVELVQALPENTKIAGKAILAQARRLPISRRLLSWMLFLPIILWFLVFPALNAKMHSDKRMAERGAVAGKAQQATEADPKMLMQVKSVSALAPDTSWNPGELARGHQNLVGGCKACHSEPFVRVKDEDCLACHKSAADHVSKQVANVPQLAETRCATCHIDHKGPLALLEQNKHYYMGNCASCHSDIKAAMPKTLTGNVSDFAKEHPQFRVNVSIGLKKTDLMRVRLDDKAKLVEKTNLKFPHDVHLDPKGVKGPQGLVKVECNTCHKIDATGLKFKPITMKDDCQSCHELRFEPAVSSRQVPHGKVSEVMTTLREFYSYVALDKIELNKPADAQISRLPAGKIAPSGERIANAPEAQQKANAAAKLLFEKTSCFICHQVTPAEPVNGQPNWNIAPIRETHVWMTKSLFPHDKHTMADCSDCHAAKKSKSEHDVLMPGIDSCRTCHAGAKPEPDKVVSNCNMCHGFHVTDHTMPPNTPAHSPENSARMKAVVAANAPQALEAKAK